jgi:hypothetical protein
MPGIFGDLRNVALNAQFEYWYQAAVASTSGGQAADLWVLGVGSGSTYIASRASTGQDAGSFCCGISYTHTNTSTLHQVAQVLGDLKGQTISFGIKVASATAGVAYPFISTDGGTTKTYRNGNTGLGATTYEQLKLEGVAVPSAATAVWYGVELRKTGTILLDTAVLAYGSAIDTAPSPQFGRSAAWTMTSGSTVRNIDMGATANTTAMQALGTLIRDLQAIGILA